MPVTTTTNKMPPYNCNGSQTIFPFTFPIFSESDLEVTLRDADGNETILTYGMHYTVSKSGASWDSGGNVVTLTTYSSGNTITIRRVLAVTQETDYVENDPFPAELHEKDHDKITMIAQQIKERADRALVFPISDSSSINPVLPASIQRASKYLACDAEGQVIAVVGAQGTYPVTPAAATILDDANIEAIRATLDVFSKGENAGSPEILTGDSILTVIIGFRKQYTSKNKHNLLTLPVSATEGDEIEISTKEFGAWIMHQDSEHVIIDKTLNTIKGVEGRLWIPPYDRVLLRYLETGYYYNMPGTKLNDPGTVPPGGSMASRFSSDGVYLAVGCVSSPYVTIYKRAGDTFTKISNPDILPTGIGYDCCFSYDMVYLAVSHVTTPFLTIYKRSGDTFTKLGNPAILPAGTGQGCDFSPDGIYLAVAHPGTPYITIYKRSGDTFTKLSNPATLPTGDAYGCAFSPDGVYLAVAYATSPFVTIYKRSGDSFTKLTDPGMLPTGLGKGAGFSPDGIYLAVPHQTTPFVTIYKRSGDTFTKLSDPGTLPASQGNRAYFSPDGLYLAVAHQTSPYVTIYKRSGDTFTKITNPGTLPTGTGNGCPFSPDAVYLAVTHGGSSPFITIYKNKLTANKAWQVVTRNGFRNEDALL